jgi:hypothetical protein
MMKQQTARALSIFKTFLKFGCFTFGGGWSIVAQMQKEYVEKEHWITDEELLDYTSVGRSTPGLMIGNASILFGYCTAGVPGALAALLGASGGVKVEFRHEERPPLSFDALADFLAGTSSSVSSADFLLTR